MSLRLIFGIVYLYSIDLTTISHIERVDHEHEDHSFKHGFASVPKYEGYNHYLGADVEQELARCNLEDDKANDNDDHTYYHIHHVVKFVHCCFRVV